jgi:hypothetical protein
MIGRSFLAGVSAAALFAVASPALADISIVQGNVPGSLSPVHLDGTDDGTDAIVNGTVNPNDTGVIITGTEPISVSSNGGGQGQAWVIGSDGGLTSLDIALADGGTFDALEFNLNAPNGGGPPVNWSVTIEAFDQDGSLSQTFNDITNNQFFNIFTTNGQHLTHVRFTTNTDLAGVGQIRLGTGGALAIVPEPAAWAMMIVGFGGVGALMRRRRGLALAATA